MKKTILFMCVVAALSVSSCKKYTCACSDGSAPQVSAGNVLDAATKCAAKSNGSVSCAY